MLVGTDGFAVPCLSKTDKGPTSSQSMAADIQGGGPATPHSVFVIAPNSENDLTNDFSAQGSRSLGNRAISAAGVAVGGVTPAATELLVCGIDGCERGFTTRSGLGLHRMRTHPVWFNEQIDTRRVRPRWTSEECWILACLEAEQIHTNPTVERMHEVLHPLFSHRTAESIRKQRMKESQKNLVQEALEELRRAHAVTPVVGVGESSSAQDDGFPPLLEELVTYDGFCVDELLNLIQKYIDGEVCDEDLVSWVRHVTACRTMRPQVSSAPSVERSGNARRRGAYARLQKLWRKSVTTAAREVLEGPTRTTVNPAMTDCMFEAWFEIFSKPAERSEEPVHRESNDLAELWAPITVEDLKATEPRFGSAPGYDGVTAVSWRRVPAALRAAFYNIIRGRGAFPDVLAKGRTVFIPKGDGDPVPLNHRPITVPSVVVRQFNKILAQRLVRAHEWDQRQRAFLPVDGCAENLVALETLIAIARRDKREFHCGSVDISKAFDTVEHSAIFESVVRHGAPGAFVGYLRRSYGNLVTVMQYAGTERNVKVTRGVRQGDPLSPILFNLVLEDCIRKLDSNIGFQIDDQNKVDALCYADDTKLMATTSLGLQKNLDTLAEVLGDVGMKLNPNKCEVLSLKPSGRQKKMKILTESQVTLDDVSLKQIGVLDVWKTLGVKYVGTQPLYAGTGYDELLRRISRAPLKPQQKMLVLSRYLMSRYLHGLVLGRFDGRALRRFDVATRLAVRRWLHLPKDVPNSFIHSPIGEGGLGIMAFSTRIPLMKFHRLRNMANSDSNLVQAITRTNFVVKKSEVLQKVCRRWSPNMTSFSEQKYWVTKLHSSVDGHDLLHVRDAPSTTKFLRESVDQLSGENFIACIQTRINCLPTRVRTKRGRVTDISCRAGCNATETNYHVIQVCPRTHGGRVLRHDRMCDTLANILEQRGMVVHNEPRLLVNGVLCKPDLVVVMASAIVVLDVHVTNHNMNTWHTFKGQKYKSMAGFDTLVKETFAPHLEVMHVPITVSYKGIMFGETYRHLKNTFGLSEREQSTLVKLALLGSYFNYQTFMKTTRRVYRRPPRPRS